MSKEKAKLLALLVVIIVGAIFLVFEYVNFPKPIFSIDQPGWLIDQASRDITYLKTFTITNKGRLPLKLSKLASSCFCVTANLSTTEVFPGKSAKLDLSFITHDLGKVERIIYFNTNDPNNKLVKFMITAEISSVKLDFFYSPSCERCRDITNFISSLRDKYPITLNRFDIADTKNYEMLVSLEEKLGVINKGIPEIMIGGKLLAGKEEILKKLETEVKGLVNNTPQLIVGYSPTKEAKASVKTLFNSFSLFPVMTAGLIDGLNPCAFTTLIFFISFLVFTGRGKKDILVSGLAFTAAVFVAYLLIGLGLFNFLRALESFSLISRALNIIISVLTIGLGLISLYDYYKYKLNKSGEMLLQLPSQVTKLIHSSIRFNSSTFGLVIASLLTGFTISVLESICTGQLYLPTIVYILKIEGLRLKAVAYLMIYNIMFVLPLLLVFCLSYFGLASNVVADFSKKYLGLVKIITALVFIGLGLLLLLTTVL